PLLSNQMFIKERILQGLSLRDVRLTVKDKNNKPIISHRMDMVFTHLGTSGPAVLRSSQFVVKLLNKDHQEVSIYIDTITDQYQEPLYQLYPRLIEDSGKKWIKNILIGLAPERYLLFILAQSKVDSELKCANIYQEHLRTI